MDQRISIVASPALARPIHRACVVPGCWCGAARTAGSSAADDRRRVAGRTAVPPTATAINLTHIVLRSVGLPVV